MKHILSVLKGIGFAFVSIGLVPFLFVKMLVEILMDLQ